MSTTGNKLFEEKKKGSWRRTEEVDGMERSIFVEETDNNGFIIRFSVSGEFPKKGKEGETEWDHRERKYISKTNPLADDKDSFDSKMKAIEEFVSDSIELNEV